MLQIMNDSVKGLMLLFIIVVGNFLGTTMNCNAQKLLVHSPVVRSIAIFFMIYLTINFTSNTSMHPSKLFLNSAFVYILFLVLMKQHKYFFIANVLLIFGVYVGSQVRDYHDKILEQEKEKISKDKNMDTTLLNESENDKNKYTNLVKYILSVLPFTLLGGFVIYLMKQMEEHEDFNIVKFLFGVNVCESLKS